MTSSTQKNQNSLLKKEIQTFDEEFPKLINSILNNLFDLKPKSAHIRMRNIIILLIFVGFFISLKPHPLSEWFDHLQLVFTYIGQLDIFGAINSILGFVNLGLQAFINPHTLWYGPAFFLPIFIAYQAASFYLADVFELNHINTAQKFISQVALTGSNDFIRISKGEISSAHRESPIYKIGGPGKLIVDLDSVALFEKADGQPKVIGPTGKLPGGKATLEGFERLRQIIDLRDHFIDLRDSSGKNSAVKSRSLDGINVIAADVRLMFSIDRGKQEPTNDLPYPYTSKAVERHVYRSTSQVSSNMPDPSIPKFNFESAILSTIRGELGMFMAQRNLTEYLANINFPEIKKAEEQENAVLEVAQLVLEPLEQADSVKKQPPPLPSFTPRHEITNLFSQFADKFTKDSGEKGVELHWIGVGTWKVPNEVVSEKHLEAWKMSHENIKMNSDGATKSAKAKARTQKILSMIQSVPLGAYQDGINGMEDKKAAIRSLCLEYRRQINESYELLCTKKKPIPPTLVAAIFFIDRIFWRIVPPPPPPPPVTPEEDRLYKGLLRKIGSWEVVERLVALELEFTPDATREELYKKINNDWDRDIAGNWEP